MNLGVRAPFPHITPLVFLPSSTHLPPFFLLSPLVLCSRLTYSSYSSLGKRPHPADNFTAIYANVRESVQPRFHHWHGNGTSAFVQPICLICLLRKWLLVQLVCHFISLATVWCTQPYVKLRLLAPPRRWCFIGSLSVCLLLAEISWHGNFG